MSYNKRNTNEMKAKLKQKRKHNAVHRASRRWDGMAKILGLLSLGPVSILRTDLAINNMAARHSL